MYGKIARFRIFDSSILNLWNLFIQQAMTHNIDSTNYLNRPSETSQICGVSAIDTTSTERRNFSWKLSCAMSNPMQPQCYHFKRLDVVMLYAVCRILFAPWSILRDKSLLHALRYRYSSLNGKQLYMETYRMESGDNRVTIGGSGSFKYRRVFIFDRGSCVKRELENSILYGIFGSPSLSS